MLLRGLDYQTIGNVDVRPRKEAISLSKVSADPETWRLQTVYAVCLIEDTEQ